MNSVAAMKFRHLNQESFQRLISQALTFRDLLSHMLPIYVPGRSAGYLALAYLGIDFFLMILLLRWAYLQFSVRWIFSSPCNIKKSKSEGLAVRCRKDFFTQDASAEQKAAKRDFCIELWKESPNCLENLYCLTEHNSSLQKEPKCFAEKSHMKELICCYFTNETKVQKIFLPSTTEAASRKAPDLWFCSSPNGSGVSNVELLIYLCLVINRYLWYS